MDAPEVLDRYFRCLESGDFAGAADCFSESGRYSHPPYADDPPGTGRHEVVGRAEILVLFQRRGLRDTRHVITATASTGDRYFISGLINDADGSVAGSFVSETVFDPELGRFTEYAAYSSRPAVWISDNLSSQPSA